MGRSKQYTVAGQHFAKQGDLEAAVKKALNSHPLNAEFKDDFLAAVVNELHDEVIAAGQKVVSFGYLDYAEQVRCEMPTARRFRGGNVLMGHFMPLDEWRDVTVYPWRKSVDNRVEIKRALRDIINSLLPQPEPTDRCAFKGCTACGKNVEYEHVNPTFDVIAEECLTLVSEDELATRFGYQKFKPGTYTVADFIPKEHPAVQRLLDLHQNNRWVWLCAYHHRNVGAV